MLVIRGPGPIQAPRRTARRSAQGFSMPEELVAGETLSSAPGAPAEGLAPLPEADDPMLRDTVVRDTVVRDRAARQHGAAALEALAALHRALLGGAGQAEPLARLEQLATLPAAADPRLDAILRAIGTRAAVELARRRVVTCTVGGTMCLPITTAC